MSGNNHHENPGVLLLDCTASTEDCLLPIDITGISCPLSPRFFLQSSVEAHMQRKTVIISLECGPCDSKITFYNRCSLRGERFSLLMSLITRNIHLAC